jgi:hypothetical protein
MTGKTEMLASPVDRALFDRIVGCGCGVSPVAGMPCHTLWAAMGSPAGIGWRKRLKERPIRRSGIHRRALPLGE